MSKKQKMTGSKAFALMAAAICGVMPAPATQATPTNQGRSVSQTQAKQDRVALPIQTQARAAYGISMMGGGYDPGMFRVSSGGPEFAPRYNQRKARRNARRVNRRVSR